jgi:hypothetical protein
MKPVLRGGNLMVRYVNPIYKRSLRYIEKGYDPNKIYTKKDPIPKSELESKVKFKDSRDKFRPEKNRIILDDD